MIFNKTDNGAEEFKGLIGFIYASNNFDNLVTYINFAKKDVVTVIGKEIYELAEDHYQGANYQSAQPEFKLINELVKLVQLPVALHAYRRFAPGNDLTHSDAGRQITVTETEKPAFEWMLDKDNANLLSLANDAIELLLDFLADQLVPVEGVINDIGTAWNNSAAYKNIKSTIVNSVADFEQVIPINGSRRLFMLLVPFMRKAENDIIKGAITNARYDALIEAMLDNDLTPEQTEIKRLASPVIVMQAMAKALKLVPAEILPDTFAKRFTDDKRTDVDTDSRLGAAQVLEQEANRDFSRLQRYIKQINPPTAPLPEVEIDTNDPFFIF